MENTVIRIMEMEDELNRQIDELVDKKQEIAEVISRIEDVSVRVILEKRYLAFLPWDRIASDMGYSIRWTLAKHEKGIEEVEELSKDGKAFGQILG